MWIYLNDRFLQERDARISVFDHGFLYGDGVYETLRSYGDAIFMREHHLARLRRSADSIGIAVPVLDWPNLLHEAMTLNDVGNERHDAYIRITLSRGPGDIGLDPALCPTPTLVIMSKALVRPSLKAYADGMSIIVAATRRNLSTALDPRIKATNFLNNIMAKREAILAGASDAVMLNGNAHLTECTVSNIFFVKDGKLCTPSLTCGILDGITREIVLSLGTEAGIPIEEGIFDAQMLSQADECFLTNTSMEIMPVTQVDGRLVGSGHPGPLTIKLQHLFAANRGRFTAK
ncbi:putative branched-chain-amino-acid aminotransferase [Nitrospira sp. KM1]|uniref:aminotransferase class IV n=1 Tax=Nitrospira sp. KM1 TaxID=1936990 RepID=UPI0013A78E43|nr:aminotransferase class IV [Nitrospira sp. KM1]BCA54741.1 putative branched-chain-amino-acid aminotransferase [Nitrospira sp. KM1]